MGVDPVTCARLLAPSSFWTLCSILGLLIYVVGGGGVADASAMPTVASCSHRSAYIVEYFYLYDFSLVLGWNPTSCKFKVLSVLGLISASNQSTPHETLFS